MNFSENITIRRPRSQSVMDLSMLAESCSSNSSTIEGAECNSVPNISLNENEEIESLKRQISELNIQLQAAHNEINNLSIENTELKKTIENLNNTNKLVKKATKLLATEISTPNKKKVTRFSTPYSKNKSQNANNHSSIIHATVSTPLQTTAQECSQQQQTLYEMDYNVTKTTNSEGQRKLCVISSNKTNNILSIAENAFSSYQICHYLKPNCSIIQLLNNIDVKLRKYSLNDYCLILIGEQDFGYSKDYSKLVMQIRDKLLSIKHTNIILCLPTYKYSNYAKI